MFRNILVGFVSAMAALLTYVAMQPAAYTVSRMATIAAPPQAVFSHINSFKKWDAWSPWAKKDPNAKSAYSGPESGEGASLAWSGNKDVGEGRMTLVESKPNERIAIKLDFTKPTLGTSYSTFALKPEGSGTSVTWSLSGESGFVSRAFMMLLGVKLDKMIGDDYEKGLANLKAVVEAGPKS